MFQRMTDNVSIISALPDRPSLSGMDAKQIKQSFDRGSELIKKFINEKIIDELNNMNSADISSPSAQELQGDTVYSQINSLAQGMLPVGAVFLQAGDSENANTLICDGSPVSRSEYAQLFSVIGTLFGNGDGTTTFNLPDMTDEAPIAEMQYVIKY